MVPSNPGHRGVQRLMKEFKQLSTSPSDCIVAYPTQDNMFEWHFSIKGPPDSPMAEGIYHGRIIFPPDYPLKPPNIVFLTPSGRFETNTKICVSMSAYHPESWQPAWDVRTALLALRTYMSAPGEGAIGALDLPDDERKRLAEKSVTWSCKICEQTMESHLKQMKSAEEPESQMPSEAEGDKSTKGEPNPTIQSTESNISRSGECEEIEATEEKLQEEEVTKDSGSITSEHKTEISPEFPDESSSIPTDSRPPSPAAVPKVTQQEDEEPVENEEPRTKEVTVAYQEGDTLSMLIFFFFGLLVFFALRKFLLLPTDPLAISF